MTDRDALIIRTLAAADAARFPVRDWHTNLPANRYNAMQQLKELGTPIRTGGTMTDRKIGERLLDDLAASGLATVSKRGRARFPMVQLTMEGELRSRALCGLPDWDDARQFLDDLGRLSDRDGKTFDRVYVDEIALNEGKGWGDSTKRDRQILYVIQLKFVFASARGWVECGSTSLGHVRYRVTPAGWQELDKPSTPPTIKLPDYGREARELYDATQAQTLSEFASVVPEHTGEIGECPLPVSHVGVLLRTA